jgi:hypothetical protein
MEPLAKAGPTVTALPLCFSHWFGPSATGRNREIAESSAIPNDFSDASAVGCGAHLSCFNLLRPSEKRDISAWK